MRLKKSISKNAISYYAIKSYFRNGKHTSKIVHKFGTHEQLLKQLNGLEPETWVKAQIERMNAEEEQENKPVLLAYDPTRLIPLDEPHSFNCGYLFLQKLFSELGLTTLCNKIARQHRFEYKLAEILATLVYTRILFPASKKLSLELADKFLDAPTFDLHQLYRALDVLDQSSDLIQAELYQHSLKLAKRNTKILYYDCTNFYFEIDQAEGLKQYGISKEHRPNPLVQMGLFMDANAIPLAFSLFEGNKNEQGSLKPLEKRLLHDFDCAQFIVCTDAGLASQENREFNTLADRAFVTTQPLKKLKKHLRDWALNVEGWKRSGSEQIFNLNELMAEDFERLFFKERWIKENGLEQRLLVTYSPKHKAYQQNVRQGQIDLALRALERGAEKRVSRNPNDHRRFIQSMALTKDGEIAERTRQWLDEKRIAQEAAFDGFYATCSNVEGPAEAILAINKGRWQIEDCFRTLKQEFNLRPVFLQRDQRIRAHFLIGFISLVIFRLLQHKLSRQAPDQHFTSTQLLTTLRNMNWNYLTGEGYAPSYTRTALTDHLHDAFGFRTDYQISTMQATRKLLHFTKK